MVITVIMLMIISVIGGAVWERYRWVRTAKNNKVIAVEGNLYKVTNTTIDTGINAG